jgi:hypothetical protein
MSAAGAYQTQRDVVISPLPQFSLCSNSQKGSRLYCVSRRTLMRMAEAATRPAVACNRVRAAAKGIQKHQGDRWNEEGGRRERNETRGAND